MLSGWLGWGIVCVWWCGGKCRVGEGAGVHWLGWMLGLSAESLEWVG